MENVGKNILIFIVLAAIVVFGFYKLVIQKAEQNANKKMTQNQEETQNASEPKFEIMEEGKERTLPNGLKITDVKLGNGEEAREGKKVTVHYVGTLSNGMKFDSSIDRGAPFTFVLGVGQVIKGWDEGVVGMLVGGKRKLVIPPELGYGSQDLGSIPPNSTLNFEVELLKVENL